MKRELGEGSGATLTKDRAEDDWIIGLEEATRIVFGKG
jgi:hypothetical protein